MQNRSLYLEDLHVGDVWTGGPIFVSEDAIIKFAAEFDPRHAPGRAVD